MCFCNAHGPALGLGLAPPLQPDPIEPDETDSETADSMPDLASDSDESNDENSSIIRAKWSIDGAKTLDEVIEKLHNFIGHIEDLKRDGWELTGQIDDDYGFIRKRQVVQVQE